MACGFCKEYEHKNGFWIIDNELFADNSYGEYDNAVMEIDYCPLCGMRLSDGQERPMTPEQNRAHWGIYG